MEPPPPVLPLGKDMVHAETKIKAKKADVEAGVAPQADAQPLLQFQCTGVSVKETEK